MASVVLNQVGAQQLTVSSIPVGITRPPVTTGDLRNEFGQTNRMTVARMLVTVFDNPVRWRADGKAPTGTFEDNYLAPGQTLDWTNPLGDFRGPIGLIQFVRDATATGDAHLECTFFAGA